jgi:hypothetical protein
MSAVLASEINDVQGEIGEELPSPRHDEEERDA